MTGIWAILEYFKQFRKGLPFVKILEMWSNLLKSA